MKDRREIDLSAKKNEAGWQSTLDEFMLAATPKLFEWFRWVLTVAVLTYVQRKTHSFALLVLLWCASALLVGYYFSYFYQFTFKHRFIRSPRAARALSLVISGALGGVTYYLVTEAIHAVAAAQP